MLSATLTFAQTDECDITEQYVDWGNNINIHQLIFMRDQNSPPPQNNMLIGQTTSALSSCGINIFHLVWPIFNMLNGVITSTLSSWGIKIRKAGHQLRANVQVAANMFKHHIMLMIINVCFDHGDHGETQKKKKKTLWFTFWQLPTNMN